MNKEFYFYNCCLEGRQLRLGETGLLAAKEVVQAICDADFRNNGSYLKDPKANAGRRMNVVSGLFLALQGLLPLGIYVWLNSQYSISNSLLSWQWLLFIPCLTMYFLYRFVWHRLRGYTGDCCGAFFLLIELSFYLVVAFNQ